MTKQQFAARTGPRVVLIDDDPMVQRWVTAVLKYLPAEVEAYSDGATALAALEKDPPALILLDLQLPDCDGLALLERLKEAPHTQGVPVILITASEDRSVVAACFERGAVDYVRKPMCAPEVRARARAVLERRALMVELERMAWHDSLTGLPNRDTIKERVQRALDVAQSGEVPCALLFLDFDHFKVVNDSLGHEAGDELLSQVAKRISANVRSTDAVLGPPCPLTGRLGGDEFVVLLQGVSNVRRAREIADRVLRGCEDPFTVRGQSVCLTASVGIALADSSHRRADDLLRDADTAMYAAKRAGRNRSATFEPEMREAADRQLRLGVELRNALAREEFFVEYQPIVSLASRRTVGFEALVRWHHPERGRLAPGEFIPVAELVGLIGRIGSWVMNEACRQLAEWRWRLGALAPRCVHVNLARQQLMSGSLYSEVVECLETHGLPGSALHLEVTESEMMQDPDRARQQLAALRSFGIKIDIDDFGTGHSSLSCIKDFPLDVLKIDRAFISQLDHGADHAALLHGICTIARSLELEVVAEGIEHTSQLAFLEAIACDFGQGYLFSPPLPPDQVPGWLERQARGALQGATARAL